MELPSEIERFSRERLVHVLRRWALLVVAAGILGGLGMLAISLALPPQYRARAELFVAPTANPTVALQEVILGQNLARSYVQLATAEVVLRPAMQKVGWTDLQTFRERTAVSQVRDTFVILITFDLDDRTRAAETANAIAESFVTQSRTVQSALQGTVSVWQPATPPREPESPRILLNTALGALGATLLVLLAIGVVSYLDDRITDIEHVRSRLGIAPLGEVHRGTHPDSVSGKLFVRETPKSMEAEAFRALRTNITFANVDKPVRSILVTSALPFEGKSVVSANLALAFAQAGTPTVLVDADLRRPSQHKLFGLDPAQGLTTLLTDTVAPETVQRFRLGQHLVVIPCGPLPPNPAELLASGKMSALIKQLTNIADGCTVIVDTSPILAVADPVALSTRVDGCILVIDAARTNARATRRAVERLTAVNATILGAVLNKVAVGHGYYRYEYYGSPETQKKDATPAATKVVNPPG
jgi:succinoglycan biosynthesis transport protein ExoP